MGYYTNYSIEYSDHSKAVEYGKALADINPNYFSMEWFEDEPIESLIEYEPMKWYNYRSDMLKLSEMFPEETFILYGDGEESDDFWVEYFRNGQSEHCAARIVYDDPVIIV